jgi:hypothetical protein
MFTKGIYYKNHEHLLQKPRASITKTTNTYYKNHEYLLQKPRIPITKTTSIYYKSTKPITKTTLAGSGRWQLLLQKHEKELAKEGNAETGNYYSFSYL